MNHELPDVQAGFRKGRATRDQIKESACNAGDLGSIPGLGRSPGEGKGYPLQYSGLENSMDCIALGVAKIWIQLRDFHFITYSYYKILVIFLLLYNISFWW